MILFINQTNYKKWFILQVFKINELNIIFFRDIKIANANMSWTIKGNKGDFAFLNKIKHLNNVYTKTKTLKVNSIKLSF
jgi:hypothetical protein